MAVYPANRADFTSSDVSRDSPVNRRSAYDADPVAVRSCRSRPKSSAVQAITVRHSHAARPRTCRRQCWLRQGADCAAAAPRGHSVDHIRHPERPHPGPMILRYLHRPHRTRHATTRGHPVPQLVEVVTLLVGELDDADGIHARCTLVGLDLLPRPVHKAFRNLKRLQPRLGSRRRLLPLEGRPRADPGLPGPWLQPITGPSSLIPVGTALAGGPPTDPIVRDYRNGLLPWVLAAKATLGWGRTMRAGGSHMLAIWP